MGLSGVAETSQPWGDGELGRHAADLGHAREVLGKIRAAVRRDLWRSLLLLALRRPAVVGCGFALETERRFARRVRPSRRGELPREVGVEVAHLLHERDGRRDELVERALRDHRLEERAHDDGVGGDVRGDRRRCFREGHAPRTSLRAQKFLRRRSPVSFFLRGRRERRGRALLRRPSRAPNGAVDVDAFQNAEQLGGLDHHLPARRGPRHSERALLEPLRDEDVPIAVPVQGANAIATAREKTYIVPSSGSAANCPRTSPARPSMPLRPSTRAVATSTRAPGGRLNAGVRPGRTRARALPGARRRDLRGRVPPRRRRGSRASGSGGPAWVAVGRATGTNATAGRSARRSFQYRSLCPVTPRLRANSSIGRPQSASSFKTPGA